MNWNRPDELTACTLSLYVSHTCDPELVRQVLLAAAESWMCRRGRDVHEYIDRI